MTAFFHFPRVRTVALGLAMLVWAAPVSAQDTVIFPEEAMPALMRVTMAQTADAKCDGMSTRKLRVQAAMIKMLTEVKDAGADPVAAVEYLKTPEANERIAAQTVALREKHDLPGEDDASLCQMIRAEAKADKDLARLMRIR